MYSTVIVDDETLICDAIRSVLETGVPEITKITIFHDGKAAYDYLAANHADILILDIEMPGKTGLDIARLIREKQEGCYILMITAYRDFSYAQEAIRCSVNEFLTKPFSSKQLISAIEKAISHFEKRSSSEEERRKADRSLLLSLCRTDTAPKGYGDIRFCQRSAPLRELACTEIVLTDIGFDAVPPQLRTSIDKTILRSAEQDSEAQTSLLVEQTQELIRILVLSKGAPDLRFLTGLSVALSAQTGKTPSITHRTYDSFARYRIWLGFEREMDSFFDLLSDGAASHAKKHLTRAVSSYSPAQLADFAVFLTSRFQTETSADPDSISRAVDVIIQSRLNTDTGNRIVESARRYIHENYASSQLSLKSAADALYVSNAYLSRLFKKHTGSNFSDYLLALRMEKAQSLLAQTNLPTTSIAGAVGYENVSYFRMSFKSFCGVTPSQYRQSQHGRNEVNGA